MKIRTVGAELFHAARQDRCDEANSSFSLSENAAAMEKYVNWNPHLVAVDKNGKTRGIWKLSLEMMDTYLLTYFLTYLLHGAASFMRS
jgi:hypothetical protein